MRHSHRGRFLLRSRNLTAACRDDAERRHETYGGHREQSDDEMVLMDGR